eukprot:5628178-Lingulodinium_polyedra.AAC.1
MGPSSSRSRGAARGGVCPGGCAKAPSTAWGSPAGCGMSLGPSPADTRASAASPSAEKRALSLTRPAFRTRSGARRPATTPAPHTEASVATISGCHLAR